MIVFDLCCPQGHRFEGWFASSEEFARQRDACLVDCPECGSVEVIKAPMAPSVSRKGNQGGPAKSNVAQPVATGAMPAKMAEAMRKLAAMQAEALKDSHWVGDKFAEQSRAMHYGESDAKSIHGQATLAEAKELHDEGIQVAPLPFPVAPPDDIN